MKPIFFLFFSLVMTACQSETSREMKSSEKTSVTVAKKELNTTKAEKVEEKIIKDTKYYRISDHPSYLFPKLEIKDAAYEALKKHPELEKFVEVVKEDLRQRDWDKLKQKLTLWRIPYREFFEPDEKGELSYKVQNYDDLLSHIKLPMLQSEMSMVMEKNVPVFIFSFAPIQDFYQEYDTYQEQRAKKTPSKFYRYKTKEDYTAYVTEKGAKLYEAPNTDSKVVSSLNRVYVVIDIDPSSITPYPVGLFVKIRTHDGRSGFIRRGDLYLDYRERTEPEDKDIGSPGHVTIQKTKEGFSVLNFGLDTMIY